MVWWGTHTKSRPASSRNSRIMPLMSRAEALSTAAPVQLTRQVFGNVPGWAQTAFYLLAAVAVGIWLLGIFRRVQLWRKGRRTGGGVNLKIALHRLVRDVILQR